MWFNTVIDKTKFDADVKSIKDSRPELFNIADTHNIIKDAFAVLDTAGALDDLKVLYYDHTTDTIKLKTESGGSGSQTPLTAEMDQDGFMIKDTSRNYQILGNTASPSSADFDSFSNTNRVYGVVNVNKVTNPSNRTHSNPRLSMVTAGQDAAASGSTANSGRLRQNYVEGIYDMAGFDNLTNGFGRGQNGMFVSGQATNSTTTTSNLTQQTALTVTPQIDTVDANSVIITDQAGVEVQAYCQGTGSSSTNFYGFYYNAPDGDEAANIGTTNHYSFYGADANATLYNAGPLVAKGLSYPTSDGSAGQVIKTDGSGVLSFVNPSTGSTLYDGGTIADGGDITPNYNNGTTQRYTLTASSAAPSSSELKLPTNMLDGSIMYLVLEVLAGTVGESAELSVETGVGYYGTGSYGESYGEATILKIFRVGARYYIKTDGTAFINLAAL